MQEVEPGHIDLRQLHRPQAAARRSTSSGCRSAARGRPPSGSSGSGSPARPPGDPSAYSTPAQISARWSGSARSGPARLASRTAASISSRWSVRAGATAVASSVRAVGLPVFVMAGDGSLPRHRQTSGRAAGAADGSCPHPDRLVRARAGPGHRDARGHRGRRRADRDRVSAGSVGAGRARPAQARRAADARACWPRSPMPAWTLRELDAIVVGTGPGPFTGLRVGMVTAAALGDALRRPGARGVLAGRHRRRRGPQPDGRTSAGRHRRPPPGGLLGRLRPRRPPGRRPAREAPAVLRERLPELTA